MSITNPTPEEKEEAMNALMERAKLGQAMIKENEAIKMEMESGKIPYYVSERTPNYIDTGLPDRYYRTIEEFYESDFFKRWSDKPDFICAELKHNDDNPYWPIQILAKIDIETEPTVYNPFTKEHIKKEKDTFFIGFIKGNFNG